METVIYHQTLGKSNNGQVPKTKGHSAAAEIIVEENSVITLRIKQDVTAEKSKI